MRSKSTLIAVFFLATPVNAERIDAPLLVRAHGLLITEGDLVGCPYHLVRRISANVRPFTAFGRKPSSEKVARELAERAKPGEGDAIVHMTIESEHVSALSMRSTGVAGDLVRFVEPCAFPIVR